MQLTGLPSELELLPGAGNTERAAGVTWYCWGGLEQRADDVWLHAEVCGQSLTLLSAWTKLSSQPAGGFSKWQPDRNLQLVETVDIAGVCIYRRYGDGVVVLVPPYLR